jgi:hypothetical protein
MNLNTGGPQNVLWAQTIYIQLSTEVLLHRPPIRKSGTGFHVTSTIFSEDIALHGALHSASTLWLCPHVNSLKLSVYFWAPLYCTNSLAFKLLGIYS